MLTSSPIETEESTSLVDRLVLWHGQQKLAHEGVKDLDFLPLLVLAVVRCRGSLQTV